MIRALEFYLSRSPQEFAAAYGNWSWALALVAAFVGLYAGVTP